MDTSNAYDSKTTVTSSRKTGNNPDYLASLRLITPYFTGSRLKIAMAVILATFSTACQLYPVLAVYKVIQAALAQTLDLHFALFHATTAALAVIAGYAGLGIAMGLSHVVAFEAICRLRLALARHMARLPLGYFTNRHSGDARKFVIDEPERLETIVAHGLPDSIGSLATWLAVSTWLFAMDWRMALAAILLTPLSFFMLTRAMAKGGKRAGDYQAANQRMNASIVEYLNGMAVVKIFNRTGQSLAETSEAVRSYSDVETKWARDFIPMGGAFYTLVLANVVVILPVGLALLAQGSLDIPTLLLFVILGSNYSQPLLKLFNQFHTLAHISMGSMLVSELLNAPPQPDTRRQVTLSGHDIVFNNVTFGYDARDVLHNVDFVAGAGQVTALVGPSGAGKSTIASLIPRFWDVRQGSITIGGVDIRDIGLDQLMDTVAFVFQSTFLFSDTIAANIRFGKPDATDAEVQAAAKAARAHEFIMALPQGYDTRLGDQGRVLSGGERQRIAIARAILKNAPVVVLDEATAFADPDNETAIQEAIGALTEGRTLIVVAHRLHTITNADQILVVDQGRVQESGQHHELVSRHGVYARLWDDYTRAQTIHLRTNESTLN